MAARNRAGSVRAFRGRSTDARALEFERHYRETYADVYNFVRYQMIDAFAAEDVTAEAFLKAARYFERYDPSRAKFATWVKSIARNCINDYYAKRHPEATIDSVPEASLADSRDAITQVDDCDLISKLLAVLDEEDRHLVYLKYYEGKRNIEIAEELDMNASTVASKLQRALLKMRGEA